MAESGAMSLESAVETAVREGCARAKAASRRMALATTAQKNALLARISGAIRVSKPALLAANHERLHAWPAQRLGPGEHVLELTLESGLAGTYVFEVATNTQRTERRFMVRPA